MAQVNTQKVIEKLEQMIETHGSQIAVAEALVISESYLSRVLSGRTEPGKKILDAIGFEKVVLYVPRGHWVQPFESIEALAESLPEPR